MVERELATHDRNNTMAHIKTFARVKPARDSQDNYHCTKEVLQVRVPGPFRDVYGERSAVLGAKATTNHNFKFTHAFPEIASQAEVFKIVSQDVVTGKQSKLIFFSYLSILVSKIFVQIN